MHENKKTASSRKKTALPKEATKRKRNVTGANTPARFPPLSTSLESMLIHGSDAEFRQLMYDFLTTSTSMLRVREKYAAICGVTAPQYSIMASIGEAGRSTVGQIAARLMVSSPFVTGEINKLMRKGIVAKVANENDRRSSFVYLSDKGRHLIAEVAPMRQFANDAIFGVLDESEAISFRQIIKKLTVSFDACLHDLDSPKWNIPPRE